MPTPTAKNKISKKSEAGKSSVSNKDSAGIDLYGFPLSISEEKILRSLHKDIASVKDKKDILKIIHPKLKQLFDVDDIFICSVNSANETLNPVVRIAGAKRNKNKEYESLLNANFPLADGFIDQILHSKNPLVCDIGTLCKKPNPPAYLIISKAAGLAETLSVSIQNGGELVGVLTLWSEKKNFFNDRHKSLISEIADLMSIVIINISYNQEIERRDAEKSLLLALSNDMALVRNHEDLAKLINQKLKKLFFIQDFTIVAMQENKMTYGAYLYDREDTPYDKKQEYLETLFNHFQFEKGLYDVVLNSTEPVIFNIDEMMKQEIVPGHIKFFNSLKIHEIIGMALRIGNKDIGILWIQPSEINSFNVVNQHVFKGVCSQISIALANIIANDKISDQLEEISNYKKKLEDENLYLQEQIEAESKYKEIIGTSAEMQKIYHLLTQVAFTNSTVLILGETGTGKELIARAIHNASPRQNKLMIKVNCAALPHNLVESELFGHERGSFTGAIDRRIGKFELANQSTLFLDEIGELTPEVQVKLLRALQEKEIERVGGKGTIRVDVRIITATNRDLQKEVEEGNFRKDLFYRLHVFPITLPALRNRKEDIPALVSHFIERYSRITGKKITSISNKAMKQLTNYNWPGNVRELEHQIERTILLTNGDTIKEINLQLPASNNFSNTAEGSPLKTIEENEREYILRVIEKCDGRIFGKNGAAKILGIPVSTLNSRIKKLGIKKEQLFLVNKPKL